MADNKLQILLELERRGRLPEDKKEILGELRRRNVISEGPSISTGSGKGYKIGGNLDRFLSGLPDAGMVAGGFGGGLLGGASGGVGSVPGSVAGGGLGRAGGRSLEELIRNLIGFKKGPVGAGTYLGEAGTGALTEVLGQAAGPVLKGLGSAVGLDTLASYLSKKAATSSYPPSINPVRQTMKSIERGTKTLGEEGVERGLYGMKPSTAYRESVARREGLGAQLGEEISKAEKSGSVVDLQKALNEIDSLKNFYRKKNDTKSLAYLEKRGADLLEQYQSNQGSKTVPLSYLLDEAKNYNISPTTAQELKKVFQEAAKSAYKKEGSYEMAAVEAEFSENLARGLRKELERIVPEAQFLNKEYHIYDELSKSLAQSLSKDLLRSGISLPGFAAGGSGAAAAGSAAAALPAYVAYVGGKSFPVKTYLAAQLQKASTGLGNEAVARNISANFLAHPTLRRAVLRALGRVGTAKAIKATQSQQKKEQQ